MKITEYIFVYGTLRKGFNNEFFKLLNKNAVLLGKGYIHAKLYDIGEYPGAIPFHNKNFILKGEIYQFQNGSEKVLKLLDEYEGYLPLQNDNSEYRRELSNVRMENGEIVKAWVYWYNFPVNDKVLINSGDYLLYLNEKKIRQLKIGRNRTRYSRLKSKRTSLKS